MERKIMTTRDALLEYFRRCEMTSDERRNFCLRYYNRPLSSVLDELRLFCGQLSLNAGKELRDELTSEVERIRNDAKECKYIYAD